VAVGVGRRTAVLLAVFLVVLVVCGVAYAENYTFKRTASGDASAGSATLRATDFPAQLRLTGGRVKPDETPSNDSCNGYVPKERDLVVVGDAESRFHDSAHSVVVDSDVELFQSAAMAAADVERGKRMLSPACQKEIAKQEHVKLVSYSLLGRPRCSCDFGITVIFETKSPRPGIDLLTILTGVRKGRFEATVLTNVGKSTTDTQHAQAALRTAVALQGLAIKPVLARLHAA
jgi:hypothetical protein